MDRTSGVHWTEWATTVLLSRRITKDRMCSRLRADFFSFKHQKLSWNMLTVGQCITIFYKTCIYLENTG